MSLIEYSDGSTTFEGYLALNGDLVSRRPCILLGHAWDGPNYYFNSKADQLAKEGFIVFAYDVYGKGVRGRIDGDNSHLLNPLMNDRILLSKRLLAAYDFIRVHPLVDPDQLGALGYCFGGLCSLDLARLNPIGLKGAISVHGLLKSGNNGENKISSSILVLHGWDDPMVSLEDLENFTREMTDLGSDWQIHCYGHAKHAFTFVGANIPELGIKYNEKAHQRSEKTILEFLGEIFNRPVPVL